MALEEETVLLYTIKPLTKKTMILEEARQPPYANRRGWAGNLVDMEG